MPDNRLLRILDVLRAAEEDQPGAPRLCQVCTDVLGVTGAGIMLMSGDVRRGSLCSSDAVSRLIEELQYTLGEGPCVDAYEQDRPVYEPDLAGTGGARWPAFAAPAVKAGARAVFGFPLRVASVRLGALDVYVDRSQPLSDDQHADALVLAGVMARSVLAMQADGSMGASGGELQGADLRYVVHQAAGMVSVQLGVSLAEAMLRLRAHAFAADRLLADVASDVVASRLRFPAAPETDGRPPPAGSE